MAKSVGLDIGSQNIRVVELEGKTDDWILNAYGSTASPLKNPIFDSKEEKDALAGTIKQLLKESGVSTREINLALPESQIFNQIIETPLLTDKELASSMQWQAEQYIPLPLEEVSFDFQVVDREEDRNKMRILLSAAPHKLVQKYIELLEKCKCTIVGIETQVLSVIRSLSRTVPEDKTATLLNLGHISSDFAFVTRSQILFTRSIPTGGSALTRAISEELNFNPEQAERYKITYGIDPAQLEGKVYSAVKPLLDQFLAELNKGFVYFKEQFPQQRIDLILITGGGALMPGIVRFMTESFGIETQRGDPLFGIKIKDGLQSPPGGGADLAVATGLAMR